MADAAQVFAYYGGPSGAIPAGLAGEAFRACGTAPTPGEVEQLLGGKTSLSQADFTALLGKCPPIMDGALTADLFSVYDQKGEKTISINELKAQLGEAISKGQVTEAELKNITRGYVTKGMLNYEDFGVALAEQ